MNDVKFIDTRTYLGGHLNKRSQSREKKANSSPPIKAGANAANWFAAIPPYVKIAGVLFSAALAYHLAAVNAATAPFRDDALDAQKYLGSVSNGGRHYRADLTKDEKFNSNLAILFNVNNTYAGSWFIYDPWALDLFKCPFMKQYRQFVKGESERNKWITEAKFLRESAVIASSELYEKFDDSDRAECLPTYVDINP